MKRNWEKLRALACIFLYAGAIVAAVSGFYADGKSRIADHVTEISRQFDPVLVGDGHSVVSNVREVTRRALNFNREHDTFSITSIRARSADSVRELFRNYGSQHDGSQALVRHEEGVYLFELSHPMDSVVEVLLYASAGGGIFRSALLFIVVLLIVAAVVVSGEWGVLAEKNRELSTIAAERESKERALHDVSRELTAALHTVDELLKEREAREYELEKRERDVLAADELLEEADQTLRESRAEIAALNARLEIASYTAETLQQRQYEMASEANQTRVDERNICARLIKGCFSDAFWRDIGAVSNEQTRTKLLRTVIRADQTNTGYKMLDARSRLFELKPDTESGEYRIYCRRRPDRSYCYCRVEIKNPKDQSRMIARLRDLETRDCECG